MNIKQETYQFDNLLITQTVYETKDGIIKANDVSRFDGENYELLSPSDTDYSKAIILMLNKQNELEAIK